jgi:hypothetical protein
MNRDGELEKHYGESSYYVLYKKTEADREKLYQDMLKKYVKYENVGMRLSL